jgi:CBS domain-containing protein
MVPLAASLAPEDTVAKAAWAMAKEEMNVIPVVDEGRPLGIVRLRDIFDAVVEASLVQHGGAVEASG